MTVDAKPKVSSPPTLLQRSKELAREHVQATVKSRYFPEIWNMLGNWFQSAKVKSVLEVGYGIGLVGESLARSGWQVTCIDASATALDDLRKRFLKAGIDGVFEQGEPERLPYASGSCAFVVCMHTLEFSRQPAAVLAEIARVLAPGGRAVIATFNKMSPWGLPAVARTLRFDDGKRAARFFGREEFLRLLQAQGFKVDHVYDRAAYLPVAAAHGKLKLPFAGAFVALVEKDKETKSKTRARKSRAAVKITTA